MRKKPPLPRSVTLLALRKTRGLSQGDLAELAGVSENTVSAYETEKEPSHELLIHFGEVMDYQPAEVESVLFGLTGAAGSAAAPRSPVDPAAGDVRLIRREAARQARVALEVIEGHVVKLVRAVRARRVRRKAKRLWTGRLKLSSPEQRRLLIEKAREFQTWALAERLCHESLEVAPDRADRAMELAKLACRVAELAPGSKEWCSRLLGYSLGFLANMLRVMGNLDEAERAFARSSKLWDAGAAADPGLLAKWQLLSLQASLHRDQRRFSEALDLLDRAHAAAPREAHGRILVGKAFTLQQQGKAQQAIEALREAAPLMDRRREPRLAFGLLFNLTTSVTDLGRHAEAEALLPSVREMALALRNELDLWRVMWLTGKVDSGAGRIAEARAAFEQVRRAFTERAMAYDCALVTLDLAALLLEQGQTSEVRRLAAEMLWIFKAQGIHREALAALDLFRKAAEKEEATAEQARQVIAYLLRARKDPGLRFHE
ncbi:MAG TPA: helix-turn-helix transcriptional regulator [Thermoanaerobaculia bacterium]|jgi:tetratricopeptide (TPR) repeat protein/DNA-binding XRE family transcriptional regulator|nr:helix-turn-helix transcriptional regulator [Thermoanaerobaculia bacterium]